MAKSRNLPGVTKALTWVRLGGANVRDVSQANAASSAAAMAALTSGSVIVNNSQENIIELLDSPGRHGSVPPLRDIISHFLEQTSHKILLSSHVSDIIFV